MSDFELQFQLSIHDSYITDTEIHFLIQTHAKDLKMMSFYLFYRPAIKMSVQQKRLNVGRHKEHKLHFGWLHYTKGSYKQVKHKQGGGTRILKYIIDDSQTFNSLITLGKELFFPEGKSQHGSLNEMEISLSHFDGTVISERSSVVVMIILVTYI